MPKLTDGELLAQANALDKQYAEVAAFDNQQACVTSKTVYKVSWDNGMEACGTFSDELPTGEEATTFGEAWVAESIATWELSDEDIANGLGPSFDVDEVQVPADEPVEDEDKELCKAALNMGQP